MLKLTPSFKEKVWGSTHLEPFFPNTHTKIGEVWFEGIPDPRLLIKFLFTTENLSVQVHPDDAYARLHHNSFGKTEMWHVLAAEPGAKIAAGFREPITKERLRAASLSGEIENLIQWHIAKTGDTFFIPAGTVHAIGAGLTICEIQQHSDITYRLYDYGRLRELHLDRAAEVANLGSFQALQIPSQTSPGGVLTQCQYFTTSKLCISPQTKNIPPSDRAQILVQIEGSAMLNSHPSQVGDVWYLEETKREIPISGNATFLQVLH